MTNRLKRTAATDWLHTVDQIPFPVCALDAQGLIVFVNAAWRAGLRRAGVDAQAHVGLDYLRMRDSLHRMEGEEGEMDRERVARGLADLVAGRRPVFEYRYCAKPPGRPPRWYRLVAVRFGAGALVEHVPADPPLHPVAGAGAAATRDHGGDDRGAAAC